MKAKELREKSVEELNTELLNLLREQFNLRMQAASGQSMVLGALNSTAFRYCLMLRTLVVFSLMQSKINSIWLLFSFINLDLTSSAG